MALRRVSALPSGPVKVNFSRDPAGPLKVFARQGHLAPRVPEVDHDPVAPLNASRSARAAVGPAALDKLQSGVSVPAQPGCPKPNLANHSMRASPLQAAAVRPWRSATPKASASFIPFAPVPAQARAQQPNLWLPFSANRAN